MTEPRATWTGTISFGIISIPVKIYTATDSAKGISFRQINKKTGNRVIQPKVDSVTGKAVEEVVKGYEIAKDEYILIDEAEIEALTPDRSSSIELLSFVDDDDIDPLYMDTPYYLGANAGGDKPYVLLEKALRAKGKIAIGKFAMRSKEYLCVIRPIGDKGLAISTLRWHEQLRDNKDIAPGAGIAITEQEVTMAGQLIDAMSGENFDITVLKDTFTEEVRKLIEAKAAGREITVTEKKENEDIPDDLFAALEASLAVATAEQKAI